MMFPKLQKQAKKKRERLDPKLRAEVLLRDGACVAWLVGWPHECRDEWGVPHHPQAVGRLSIEHVKRKLGMSLRRRHDARWMVALCYGLNGQDVAPKVLRARFRDYLARLPAAG